jgi:muramoyltetrapeptide carboxypeptidase
MPHNSRRLFLQRSLALAAGSVLAGSLRAGVSSGEAKSIKPPRLKRGDLVALTAPAGAIFNAESIQKATLALENAGFRVKHGDTLTQRFGYLAGTDAVRAAELQSLFEEREVRGIIAMRGGWGCARLLPLLDLHKAAAQPKVLSGFSDITTLLLAFQAQTGMVSFHGPVGNSTWEGFTTEQFLRVVSEAETPTFRAAADKQNRIIAGGKASGILLGGNLTVLCALSGTPWMPDYTGAILFIEETEEEPYAIDRLLTQLELNGTLRKLSGIVWGACTKCDAEEPDKSFTLDEVLKQKLGGLGIPVVTGFPFGHVRDKLTLPLGIKAELDAEAGTLKLLESAVS